MNLHRTIQPGDVLSSRSRGQMWLSMRLISAFRLRLREKRRAEWRGARYLSNVAGRGHCFVAPVPRSTESLTVAERYSVGEQPRKLPSPLAPMVGRDEAVRAGSEQFVMALFVSIVGPGIGKTTVAISVVHALLAGFSGAVSFIDLSALTNPWLVPTAVAPALGFLIRAHDPFGSLVAFLGDRKILLILDNGEHVIDAMAKLG